MVESSRGGPLIPTASTTAFAMPTQRYCTAPPRIEIRVERGALSIGTKPSHVHEHDGTIDTLHTKHRKPTSAATRGNGVPTADLFRIETSDFSPRNTQHMLER